MAYTGVFIKQALFFFLFIIKTILCIHKKNYTPCKALSFQPLQWRHNDHDSVSNYQPQGCLLNNLFGHRSKKTSKLRVTGLCVGNSPGPVNSPHKRPVTRKMFPFDDVIMIKFNFNKDVNYPLYITAALESRSMQFSIRAIHLYIYICIIYLCLGYHKPLPEAMSLIDYSMEFKLKQETRKWSLFPSKLIWKSLLPCNYHGSKMLSIISMC